MDESTLNKLAFPFWGTVALLGHQEHLGKVEAVDVLGVPMIQITTPALPAVDKTTEDYGRLATVEAVKIAPLKALHSIEVSSEREVLAEIIDRQPKDWSGGYLREPAPAAPTSTPPVVSEDTGDDLFD